MEDRQIVDLYLARDEEAIKRTSEQYGARIRNIANGILGDPQSAEECENDTYLEAWNRIPPHEPHDYFFPFLGKIVRGIAVNRYKAGLRAKRYAVQCELTNELLECLPAKETTEANVMSEELTKIIERFLDTLTAEQRKVFVRRYWFCDSVRDIGARLGVSEGSVKTILFRLRKALRQYLEKEGITI